MRIWFRISKESHTVKETVIENDEDISRTKKVLGSLEQVCHDWDLAVPVWLDTTINDFRYRGKARFMRDSFPEAVDFDYMEIRVLSE